jgi:hypothetical protein
VPIGWNELTVPDLSLIVPILPITDASRNPNESSPTVALRQ